MKAVILAGGFGTRLKSVTGEDIPKPMVSIAGKPFLEHQINFLREQGITEIILTVHHMADKIKSYFGSGLRWSVNITYAEERSPLGTGGAIKNAQKYIHDTFIVLNGDSYSQINLRELIEFHKNKNNMGTVSLRKNSEGEHYGNVKLDNGKIVDFSEKSENGGDLINAGVYIFEPKIFEYIKKESKVSLEEEVFPELIENNGLNGYEYEGYFIDIGRPETYHKFKQDVLKALFLSPRNEVIDALKKISKNEIDLVFVVDNDKRLLGVVTDKLIKKHFLKGGDLKDSLGDMMIRDPIVAREDTNSEEISRLLMSGIERLPIIDKEGRIVDVEFRKEKVQSANFPVVRGKSPLRVSFAGGGTDLPEYFEKHGGVVINTTIDKYCYATVKKRADSKIIINSDLGEESVIDSLNDIGYDGKFNLIKAIVNVMKPGFGFEIYLYNDIPPGRGLGSSASAAVLIANLLSNLMGIKHGDYKISEIAHIAETQELKIKGGWQDQYAAVTGGFNFMEFNKDKSVIYPLRLKKEIIHELNHHLMLCYVGKAHSSMQQQSSLSNNLQRSEEEVLERLEELKSVTLEIKDNLLTNNLKEIGNLLHKSWELKKALSNKISDPKIDNLYETGIKNGATGGKLLGSGGGGYILFFYNPEKRNQLKRSLESIGGEVMDFNFEDQGAQIWNVQGS